MYAIRSYYVAEISGEMNDVSEYYKRMRSIENKFDKYFWQDNIYRSPDYSGKTDDRGNALSIYVGLASSEKCNKIASFS